MYYLDGSMVVYEFMNVYNTYILNVMNVFNLVYMFGYSRLLQNRYSLMNKITSFGHQTLAGSHAD